MSPAAPARAPRGAPRPHRTPPKLRLVDGRTTRRRRVRFAVLGAVVMSVVFIFGLVAFNVYLIQTQFELERIDHRVEAERREFERLRLETARLASPERILDFARRELGLVDPHAVTHLTAPSDGTEERPVNEAARAWAEVKPALAAQP